MTMYRRLFGVLQGQRCARAACAVMMMAQMHLTTVCCLCQLVAYHKVTPTHAGGSRSEKGLTDSDPPNPIRSDLTHSTSLFHDLMLAPPTSTPPSSLSPQTQGSTHRNTVHSHPQYKKGVSSSDGSLSKSSPVIFFPETQSSLRTKTNVKERDGSFDLKPDTVVSSWRNRRTLVSPPCCSWWNILRRRRAHDKKRNWDTTGDSLVTSRQSSDAMSEKLPDSGSQQIMRTVTINGEIPKQSGYVSLNRKYSGLKDSHSNNDPHNLHEDASNSQSLRNTMPISVPENVASSETNSIFRGEENPGGSLLSASLDPLPVRKDSNGGVENGQRATPFLYQFNSGGLGTVDFHRIELSVASSAESPSAGAAPFVQSSDGRDAVSAESRQKREAVSLLDDIVRDDVTTEVTSSKEISSQSGFIMSKEIVENDSGDNMAHSMHYDNVKVQADSSVTKDGTDDVLSKGSLSNVDGLPSSDTDSNVTASPPTADSAEIGYKKRDLSSLTTCPPSLSIASSMTGSGFSSERSLLVNLGIILPFQGNFPWVIYKTHPALVLAVERVEREGVLPNNSIQLVLRDSVCSETYGPLQGIDLYVEKAANVFVGPACDYAVAPLARFSFRWQIPILTAGALVTAFQDRREYRLLTRVQGAYSKAGEFLHSVFETFGWRWAGLVYHDKKESPNHGRSDCYFTVEAIYLTLHSAYGREPWYRQFDAKKTSPGGYAEHLKDISKHARVVVLCASPNSVREIMIKAHELNFDNGEYVFFNIDLFSSKNDSRKPWYREGESDERNDKARKAYEALMTVTLRKPTSPEYRAFSNDVKQRARLMYPNFTYGEEEVNSFVGAFHDAVLLYALALNETLEANGSISDGAAITQRMWNRTFEGITGNVSIDSNGDRNADYSLLDLNPATGQFEVVANYYGNKKRYEPVPGKSIHWAGGRKDAPPDTPRCGFDGSKCPPDEPFPEYGIVIIVLGSILLIVIIAVVVIYRHIKLEAELAEMNWRVRWEDILFGSPEKNKKLERQGSKLSLVKRGSCPSSVSGDTLAFQLSDAGNRQLFTKTGYYKGAIIAIKSIARTNITVSKPLLLEIKRMKDLQNDHIVRFLGSCIDYPNQCLLTEYCPKGSLQDVLENEQIKLDWMFRYSIMQDIVRGMAYLQGTDIRSHGNLKSTNCVVDSRFVVKITDFGLHYFRHNPDFTEDDNDYSSYHNKLWTAPELLRMHCRPAEGTAKGDVYSFAIICQEIVYRNGVFYLSNLDLTPQEIHGKVRNGLKPYFRPTLEEYDCPCDELATVIRRCWAEDPSDRPDFTQLKTIIRKLNRDGDKGNILDNLLSRMEQYANNLEALVEERTADYLQQKKKAEDLLYNMLPRSVALQLIRGESVTAESYDNVSIYFSDICGFTAMSAESTPMQVVDLLNDLYTTFDSIIENFDVYKVETIGDAYMVVSGLPEKNGDLHAREIARMSLLLLEAVVSFRVRHRPKEQLKLRIGIHSGPVCSGVVGHKMPRYCLFGDTVNTASRMESNGLPLRIHVSQATKRVLDTFACFELESRGEVEMKGKGSMHTWWLLGERPLQESPGGGASLNIL